MLLRQSPFYTASTSVSPSLCYAFIKGQNLYSKQRKKLQQNLTSFQKSVYQIEHISFHPQLPIFILTHEFDQNYFTPHNIIISSFPYPNPSGKKINRIVLNALHTKEDMETIASKVEKKNGGQRSLSWIHFRISCRACWTYISYKLWRFAPRCWYHQQHEQSFFLQIKKTHIVYL